MRLGGDEEFGKRDGAVRQFRDEVHYLANNGSGCCEPVLEIVQEVRDIDVRSIFAIEIRNELSSIDEASPHRQLRSFIRRRTGSSGLEMLNIPFRCAIFRPRRSSSSPFSISSRTTSERVFPSALARRVSDRSWSLVRRIVSVFSIARIVTHV